MNDHGVVFLRIGLLFKLRTQSIILKLRSTHF